METQPTPAMSSQSADFYDGANYDSERSVGLWLRRAHAALQRSLDQRMDELDLTGMQWGPLWMIAHKRADTVAACAREAGNDAGAMTRMLDRLEAKGLLVRERSTQDRRVVHVSLTPRGAEIAARIPHILAEVLNQHLRGFSAVEVETLLDLLQRFARSTEPGAV
jgi:DNA-binding MarR family transcriptional regulator